MPPTLLPLRKQHSDFPIRVEQVSRLIPVHQVREIKKDIEEGHVDIVIGTHALLAKDIAFSRVGFIDYR